MLSGPSEHGPALARPPFIVCAWRAAGAGIAIAIMEYLAGCAGLPVFKVPFVTSIVLVMSMPESSAAKPRAIIGGHLIACACGFICLRFLGGGEASSAVAVGLVAFSMVALSAMHPPAGIDAFIVPAEGLPISWVIVPVLAGAVLLSAFGRLWYYAERRVIPAPCSCRDKDGLLPQ
jgi:CBS-domain-containing membrane protein